MALATDLEIHKTGTELLDLCTDVQAHIPRSFRASMGHRIADECVQILVLIGRANAARQPGARAAHLEDLLERLHVVQILMRTAHARKLIVTSLWAKSIELTNSIGKQSNGWLTNTRARPGYAPAAAPAAAAPHTPAGYGTTASLFGSTAAPAA